MFESFLGYRKPTLVQLFKNIVAHEDLKEIIGRSVYADNRTATLMIGPPGTAKTLFMLEICKKLKNWYFFDGTITSGKGLIDFMYNHRNSEGICIDELDKLNKREQATLYNFLETGQIRYETSKTKLRFVMEKTKVIATSNSIEKLTNPLKSRFVILTVQPYSYEEFQEISIRVLVDKYNIHSVVAAQIANVVWNEIGSKDVRMCLHIGSRIGKEDLASDIEELVKLMIKLMPETTAEYN